MEEKDVEQLFCRATKMGRQTERNRKKQMGLEVTDRKSQTETD